MLLIYSYIFGIDLIDIYCNIDDSFSVCFRIVLLFYYSTKRIKIKNTQSNI
jgi:hypothetical protein